MNVINVHHIERELTRIAATALHAQVRDWFLTVPRNAIINGAMSESDFAQNFTVYIPSKPPLDAPPAEALPEWAREALATGQTLHWFESIQPQKRPFWKMIEAVSHWFNSWASDDRRLNRVSRVSFQSAINAAAMWNKEVSQNLWNYVQDRPPVIFRSGAYAWVRLLTELHFEREERLMNHCIYRAGYFRTHEKGTHAYYSLRDSKNRPHVTIELRTDSEAGLPHKGIVQQCKGNSNHKPAKAYQAHITALLKHMQWPVAGDGHHIDEIPIKHAPSLRWA